MVLADRGISRSAPRLRPRLPGSAHTPPMEAIVVPAPGKHRKPEALPPAPAPVPYEDHPSAPQPRFSDPDWAPPYEDYPSWPHPGEPSQGRPPRRGDNGLDVR